MCRLLLTAACATVNAYLFSASPPGMKMVMAIPLVTVPLGDLAKRSRGWTRRTTSLVNIFLQKFCNESFDENLHEATDKETQDLFS